MVSWFLGKFTKTNFHAIFLGSCLRRIINVKHIKIVVQYGFRFKTEELWFEQFPLLVTVNYIDCSSYSSFVANSLPSPTRIVYK